MKIHHLKLKKTLLLSLKVGIGTSLAILVAYFVHLKSPIAAGTIAMLTILSSTRKQTLSMILARLWTFAATIVIVLVLHYFHLNMLLTFGLTLFFMVLASELAGVGNTLPVNVLIVTHLQLVKNGFSWPMILNETGLMLIGLVIGYVLNLIQFYTLTRKELQARMEKTDELFKAILEKIVCYIKDEDCNLQGWKDIERLEKKMFRDMRLAKEYQENSNSPLADYYINYFTMRETQIFCLKAMYKNLRQVREIPEQAAIIADYVEYLTGCLFLRTYPQAQQNKLDQLQNHMDHEPLPQNRQEFKDRAIFYMLLSDLQEFINLKEQFIKSLKPEQLEYYERNMKEGNE